MGTTATLFQLPRASRLYPQRQFALADAGIRGAIIKGGGFRTTGPDIVGSFAKSPNHDPLGTPIRPTAISMLDMARPDLSKGLMQSALESGHVQVVFHKELVAILDDDSNGSNVMVSVKDLQTGLLEEHMVSFLMTKERLVLAVDTKELTKNTEQ